MTSHRSVRATSLSVKQDALLHSLERQVALQMQAATHASLVRSQQEQDVTATLHAFLTQQQATPVALFHDPLGALDPSLVHLKSEMDKCMAQWTALRTHAYMSHALVTEMETSHAQVTAKTQALYRKFEAILDQVETLETRVATIAAPLPYFLAIEDVARALGFGVTFAAPSSSPTTGHTLMENTQSSKRSSSSSSMRPQPVDSSKAVQVFQHRRGIDPTTHEFEQALDTIDASMAYLKTHVRELPRVLEYKDAACFLAAYRVLLAGGMKCLKEYAMKGLEAATDAVVEAVHMDATTSPLRGSSGTPVVDETSAYYVTFQRVAPALAAVAKHLKRLHHAHEMHMETAATRRVLGDVVDMYARQRVHLLSPVLSTWLTAVSDTSDLVTMLRVACAHLLKVTEAEFRLFRQLFGHEPCDDVFVAWRENVALEDAEDGSEATENAFERLIFQLGGLLYNSARPHVLAQKDLDVLCEVIHVLRSEVIEAAMTPRAAVVGSLEPVVHRLIQDAQERLILCMQKYIRDEIQGFVPTPADLDYPRKLVTADASGVSRYATWYPSLEHTLRCLSKGYHCVKVRGVARTMVFFLLPC
ncbi:hypothetical protein PsorP6_011306 [Peronosclerospora sorghi]|uniref:Uncharacterized protein n=1 Tax=Peronosclerospora sorghi TaxID=230839 RepID=A0ACC0WLE4_9STRA|nr:hypothetical protein PsorP6_011306 [Peronosclerospora sorghi]